MAVEVLQSYDLPMREIGRNGIALLVDITLIILEGNYLITI